MTKPNMRGPTAAQINSLAGEDGPLPWADDQAEPLTAEQIARATDAINFVLVAAAVPFEHRAIIDALIGASLGAMDWFECADIVIAQRARNASKLEVKEKSTEKWTQRERDALTEWQTARGITLVESMPGGWAEGVKYKTRYRLANLFRLAIATDRRARRKVGFEKNPKRELRKAAEVAYLEFRADKQEPAKTNRFRRGRRTCDTYLKIINTALNQLSGRAYIENRNLVELLDGISLKIQEKRELLIPSLAPVPNHTQTQQTQTDNAGGMVDSFVHLSNGAKTGAVHTSQKEEYGHDVRPGQPSTPAPPLLGVSMEEFEREMWPDSLPGLFDQPASWRDLPATERQRELILKAGRIPPATRGEASDLIAELIESGALSDSLSLAELETYDPKAGGRNQKERRFCCPLCGADKPLDDDHRSLSLNTYTGAYLCHRCHAKGVLREHMGKAGPVRAFTHTGPSKPEEKSDKWREWWAKAGPVAGTLGAKYLEGRGVPLDAARAAGVRYGRWWKRGENKAEPFNAVLFPVFDLSGNLVAVQARAIFSDVKRTGGDKSQGVFLSAPDALQSPRLSMVESPIDALVLATASGFPAVATLGTTWAEWLPDALEGKDVAQAQDADEAGDKCAAALTSLLTGRATTWRLRPVGAKDWAELAEREGLDAVCECAMDATERADALDALMEAAGW